LVGKQDTIQLFFRFIIDKKVEVWRKGNFGECVQSISENFGRGSQQRNFFFGGIRTGRVGKQGENTDGRKIGSRSNFSRKDDFFSLGLDSRIVAEGIKSIFFIFERNAGGFFIGKLEVTGKGEGSYKRKKSDSFKGFIFGGSGSVFASWEDSKFEIVRKVYPR
jgi:hypothetical protein